MPHESSRTDTRVAGSSDRAFGLVFAGLFGLLALVPWLFGRPMRGWVVAIACAFLVIGLVVPRMLSPLNRLWLRFGLLLHKVTSPLILGIMFFGVVTPIGLLMRALGKDVLRLKRDPSAKSYWVQRRPPGPTPESLKDQF